MKTENVQNKEVYKRWREIPAQFLKFLGKLDRM